MLLFLCRKTLEDRLKLEEKLGTLNVSDTTVGSKQATFKLKKVRGFFWDNMQVTLGFAWKNRNFKTVKQMSLFISL